MSHSLIKASPFGQKIVIEVRGLSRPIVMSPDEARSLVSEINRSNRDIGLNPLTAPILTWVFDPVERSTWAKYYRDEEMARVVFGTYHNEANATQVEIRYPHGTENILDCSEALYKKWNAKDEELMFRDMDFNTISASFRVWLTGLILRFQYANLDLNSGLFPYTTDYIKKHGILTTSIGE